MKRAQAIVAQADNQSTLSVKQGLAAVTEAHAACANAKLSREREQLLKTKNEIGAQLTALQRRGPFRVVDPQDGAFGKKNIRAPTGEELARVLENGDPSCPKGQAYGLDHDQREVRCSGPQLVDMGMPQLKRYFGDRRYEVTTRDRPAELRAENRLERYVFSFDGPSDSVPRCVNASAVPGMSWQGLASRLTGIARERLKPGTPVKSAHGQLALEVEQPPNGRHAVHLGRCTQIAGPL
jgi:hypothetical protein